MEGRISHSGMLARSPEGHAARGMQIKGNEDLWVEIQANTFRNWVNEHLPRDQRVADLTTDLCSGVRLCMLVESLQGRPMRPAFNRNPATQHHCLENVTAALKAIELDGVKLVNIGNVDIVNGNLKLILGLIWSLIVRYQIGRSKFPPRKLMLAWLQAVLPECEVHNLTTDWNSGILLSALIDYCRPGLFSHWRNLDKKNSIENCRRAMSIAQSELGIPAVLEPEYLASPWLDELSGMTYLSYFMKPESPGFYATLRWVNSRLNNPVRNFTTDWNDGKALSEVVRSLGGSAQPPEKLSSERSHWEDNLNQGITAGRKLGVLPVLSAHDMADKNVEHLGVMAYAAHFQWIPERPPLHDLIQVHLESTSGRVGEPMHFSVELLDKELSYNSLSAEIRSPDNKIYPCGPLRKGRGSFVPQRIGMHEIIVSYGDDTLQNSHYFRAMPPLVQAVPPGMAPCAIGSIVQVLVNATGAPRTDDINVTAYSPHNRPLKCPLQTIDGTNTATFKPDEAGEWRIEITYQGKHIQGGPYTCQVFDPRGVHIYGLEGAMPLIPHVLEADAKAAGVQGELHADVVHDKRSVHVRIERVNSYQYKLHFTPRHSGKHRVYVYFNGHDVKGSPFIMRVGTQRGKKSSSNSPNITSRKSTSLFESSNNGSTYKRESPDSHNHYSSYDRRTATSDARKISTEILKSSSDAYQTSERKLTTGFKSLDQRDGASNLNDSYNVTRVSPHISSPSFATKLNDSHKMSSAERNMNDSYKISTETYKTDITTRVSPHLSSPSFATKLNDSHKMPSTERNMNDSYKISTETYKTDITTRVSPHLSSPSFATKLNDSHKMSSLERNMNDSYKISTETYKTDLNKVSPHLTSPAFAAKLNDSHKMSSAERNILSDTYSSDKITKQPSTNIFTSNIVSDNYKTSTDTYKLTEKNSYEYDQSPQISSNFITSKHNEKYNFGKIDSSFNTQSDTSYVNKFSSMKISESRSPVFMTERSHDMSYNKVIDEQSTTENNISSSKSGLRHDSWDAIAKTKNLLSYRSLESVANLAGEKSNESTSHYISRDNVYDKAEKEFIKTDTQDLNETRTKIIQASKIGSGLAGAQSIKVQPVPDGILGQPVEFEIDGSGAGSGDLEILVEGGRVTSSVRSLGGQRFRAAFTPHQVMPHRVDIRFNGETVPGSPWHVNIMSSSLSVSVMGDSTRLVPANSPAVFEIITSSTTLSSDELTVNVISPSKRVVPARAHPGHRLGVYSVEFLPTEVGTHIVEVSIGGDKIASGPLIAKVYDASLIQVADVSNGVVGQPVQFRVDASQAGEGQLEISINEGEVPNHVQVVGGGRCIVSFTPDIAKPHMIDIKFNGETVRGCPFVCSVTDTSRVTLSLSHLELVPINQTSSFHMNVGGGGAAELAVAVRSPIGELPVKVTGDIHTGFTAEFTPVQVGAHTISVEYNGRPVQGTPYIAKAFDAKKVSVGSVSRGTVGCPVTFTVDASEAGEGNLEITISAHGLNIPTQVHPQGNARFAVSFIPTESCDHVVNVAFNKRPVEGCPLIVSITGSSGGPSVTLPGPSSVHRPSTLLINHPGKLEDIEVNVEGPGGQAVPTQVLALGSNAGFRAEFVPRVVGEHRVNVLVSGVPVSGSPYAVKVYDVHAIKVKETSLGIVGKPVTFLVETSQAGPGNLEVTVNGGRVPTSAQAQGPHTYAISFTPREATPHSVDLRFNGQDVPGSPFTCSVAPAARVIGGSDVLDKVSVGHVCKFSVESPATPIVEILGPARRPVSPTIIQGADCKYDIEFTPSDVGDHSVEVRLPGGHIEGSPFLIKAYDANRVSVTDITDGVVGKPVSFNINASQAGAGNLEIIVAVGGKNVPNFVQSEGNARFKVNFKPTEAATHSLSVRFNGQPVPGSPFTCKVSPGHSQHRIPVSGTGLELASLGEVAEINLEGVLDLEPQILVTSPTGTNVKTSVNTRGNLLIATFTPEVVGRHSVSILINDQHIVGSPFSCNVYDVSKVHVSGLPNKLKKGDTAEVGKPVTFSVDAAQAGEGTLELVVSTKHSTVKAEVVACARGLYDVTFIPQSNDDHYINITFNDAPVPGSPFECPVSEPVHYVQIGSIAKIELPSKNHHVEVIDGNGKKVSCDVQDVSAKFSVSQIGTYRVHIYEGSTLVTTRTVNVFDATKIEVVSAPEAICHRPAVVGISLKNAGPGILSASVKFGNKDVPHSVRQSPNNPKIWEVVFHPENAAPHKVMLMLNGVPKAGILEVPVKAPSTEPWAGGLGLYQAQVGKVTAFTIETLGKPAREFDVVVSGPTGSALPVRCYQTRTGRLQAEWTASIAGPHRVEVLHQARPIIGSPFTCNAFSPQLLNLSGPPMQVPPGEIVVFDVNSKEAGQADLEVAVTNSMGQFLPVRINQMSDTERQVSFVVGQTGLYTVSISYGGIPLHDSPFSVTVGALPPQPPPRAVGPGLEAAQVGETTSFTVSCGMQPIVKIEAVEGHIPSTIKCIKPGEYVVSYIPLWVGTYDVIISCGNQTLAGSPFRPTVVDPKSVRVIGGWQQYLDETNKLKLPCKVAIDTTNAGPGSVECIIAERKVPVETNGNRARLDLSAEGLSSGEHSLLLTYGNIRIPSAPQYAVSYGDQVILTGRGLAQAQCDEVSTFNIDGSRAGPGSPEATLHSAEGNIAIPISLSPVDDSIWKAQYTVSSPGTYLLSVLWAGRPVRGCPLMVEAKGGADASKVLCSGEGLRNGVVGREIRSWIDTRRAGPGELTAHCAGPRKVAYCELYDHGDATFTLNVKPQEPGKHLLTIKYAGKHVPGSPFALRVAGAPDASKVRVYGPGIEHGVLATFQSRFICDTRGAGAGQLTVRVRGPKGAFRVEMQRESQKDRTILCKYDPTEPGDYRVEVKWAGELVPGSPFPVMIFDTQEELRRYLNSL